MTFNKKNGNVKKNGFSETAFVESYGKTEAVNGGGMPGGYYGGDAVGATVAADGNLPNVGSTLGVTDLPGGGGGIIENFQHTMAADTFVSNLTGEVIQPVVGWLVCIKGPNKGREFRIHSDYNYVGSLSGDIVIAGDTKISRERHMTIAYDSEQRKFFLSPASGANMIRLNDNPLLESRPLNSYDRIRTGDSVFLFIAFCGEKFGWDDVING